MKPEDKEIIKETLKASRLGFGLFFGFWIAGWLGAPFILLYSVASAFIVWSNIKHENTAKELLIDWLFLTGIIILGLLLGRFFGGKGLLGVIIVVLVLTGIILYRRRKLWLDWVHHIERRFLYGETLEERRKRK